MGCDEASTRFHVAGWMHASWRIANCFSVQEAHLVCALHRAVLLSVDMYTYTVPIFVVMLVRTIAGACKHGHVPVRDCNILPAITWAPFM